jgi:hypothetical protein
MNIQINNPIILQGQIIMMMHMNDYKCFKCGVSAVRLYRFSGILPICKKCKEANTTDPYICGLNIDVHKMPSIFAEWSRFPENE